MSGPTRFVIAGFGNVGHQIASLVALDGSGQLEIAAVAGRDLDKTEKQSRRAGLDVPVVAAAEAHRHAPVVVECGTYDSFRDIVEPNLAAGAHVVCVSAGALAVNLDLLDLAEEKGTTLQIANGAMPGLDIIRAAREAGIDEVRLVSSIVPRSLEQEDYVREANIDLSAARNAAVPVFKGTAREAAGHFPRHFNVAVSLSLAGIGLDRTMVDISADGRLEGARHTVHVVSSAISLEMTSQNHPSPGNNRTSRIVAPSILAALRKMGTGVSVGS